MLTDEQILNATPIDEALEWFYNGQSYHPVDTAKIMIQLGRTLVDEGKARLKRAVAIEDKLRALVGKEVTIAGPHDPEIMGILAYRPDCYYIGDTVIFGTDEVTKAKKMELGQQIQSMSPDQQEKALALLYEIDYAFDYVVKVGIRRITLG